MKNLSKKHIYRKDHDSMMAWRQSMRTNARYMFIAEQIKRRKKK